MSSNIDVSRITSCAKCKTVREIGEYCRPCRTVWRLARRAKIIKPPYIPTCRSCGLRKELGKLCKPCRNLKLAVWRATSTALSNSPAYRAEAAAKCNRSAPLRLSVEELAARKEALSIYGRDYYVKNGELIRANVREYKAKDPQRKAESDKRYAQDNPEKIAMHHTRRRAKKAGALGSHTQAEWTAVLRSHRSRCANCGIGGKMTKDHIIPLSEGGPDYAFNLQPLCQSCNSSKGARIAAGSQHSLFERKPD